MTFTTKIFETFVLNYTSEKTRSKWSDSEIKDFSMSETEITALVKGSDIYDVKIEFSPKKILKASCNCSFNQGPICKHIVHVLHKADDELVNGEDRENGVHPTEYRIEKFKFPKLTNTYIMVHSMELPSERKRGFLDFYPNEISINHVSFMDAYSFPRNNVVDVKFENDQLILNCSCPSIKRKMCEHQAQALYNIKDREEISVFFDEVFRKEYFHEKAKEFGLEEENNLDNFFELEYDSMYKRANVLSKIKELLPINQKTTNLLEKQLLPQPKEVLTPIEAYQQSFSKQFVIIGQHRYYDHIYVDFVTSNATKDGRPKNPITKKNPVDLIWKAEKQEEIKFFTALAKFQSEGMRLSGVSDIDALKAIVKNPSDFEVYYHNESISDNLTSSSIVLVQLKKLESDLILDVNMKEKFYEISGQIEIDGIFIELKKLKLVFNYFVLLGETMYLIDNPDVIRVINFFKSNNQKIIIHKSKYKEFQEKYLANLEHRIKINYTYLKLASKKQIIEKGFDKKVSKIIYLSDSDGYIAITPVLKYGDIEIPILSKKQIYSRDKNGNEFLVERDIDLEYRFLAMLIRQHQSFEEQLNLDSFYIHSVHFLEGAWFLEIFDQWRDAEITILGFSELKNNRYNGHKASVTVSVSSGLDWFDTAIKVKYGEQDVTLKQLQKAVKNKTKFVELGDGTLGLLPEEWIEKFSKYFRVGEVQKEVIRTNKINFSEISELYEDEVLTSEARDQIAFYQAKLASFNSIQKVKVPKALNATLRDYQKEGLNWLIFLDDFGFGGCLADDMGLGKTIQILAFILSQREKKVKNNTNLIVVPTSLIFNWQNEIEKFAPSIKLFTIYGADRVKNTEDFHQFEIILTSYGTLLSDIRFLKEFEFNYVILDESQAIKNPESQRYKSVRLLKSRNKLVLTGTPIENNTFDLYGQFSFACPGLLGNKTAFKDLYAMPIDKFKDFGRAKELQKKINPFLLRRTKSQVAKELPDKTEMVLYCEMGEEQRKVYDTYKQEFRAFLIATSNQKKYMDSMHVLAGLTKLRQICNSPALINDEEYYGDQSSKIEVLMGEITSKQGDHKMIVFSQFVTMLDLIKKELDKREIKYEYLTGQTKDRETKVNNFQTNDEVRVFLISLKAGGTGLNLTEADYVYLVDPWWNPAVENQAIDRCYRIGQKKNVFAVRLICPDTIEDKIRILQDSKKELATDLVKTDTSILKSLNREDLVGIL